MERQRWDNRMVFLLAAVGSAAGLGNLWRFPYLTGKYGGGAFLVPYFIALFIIGIPLLILEFALGQFMQRGIIGSLQQLHPAFASFGFYALISSFIIVSYYAVIMAWSVIYLLRSFGVEWTLDAENYFFQNVLQLSERINSFDGINWNIFLSLIAVWILIYFCIWRGTRSVSKVVMYSVPLPVLLMSVLFVRAITLPGFIDGWQMFLTPAWSALLSPEVWVAAFSQIFFSLSLGFGTMVTYGSYKNINEDIAKNAWLTALSNSFISIFAGFVVFGVLGYIASVTDTPLAELAASGPGLAFVVFPQALSLMPWSAFVSFLFFLMILSLGIDTAFSIVEAVNAAILDKYRYWRLSLLSLGVCSSALVAGIIYTTKSGLYFLDIADHFASNYNLTIMGIVQTISVGWLYGAEKLRRQIDEVSEWRLGKWWNVSIKYIIPLILTSLLVAQFSLDIQQAYGGYPLWALAIGWSMVFIPLILVLIYSIGLSIATTNGE